MEKSIKIIQISDAHLFADGTNELLSVNTLQSLQAVLDLIRFQNDIDLIVLTGDLSQDGSSASYKKMAELLRVFPCPIYFYPGNHDDLNTMNQMLDNQHIFSDKQILKDHWQIILLNSQKPKAVEGQLAQDQLDFLAQCLAAHPDKYALVMLHHHPVKVNSAWIDKIGLQNANAFWQVIQSYQSVKAVVYGHIHQENVQVMHGIPCYSSPSTCIQFKCQSDNFALENLPPGYRQIELFADGTIKTAVHRVAEYVGHFDVDAKGY